MIRRPLAAAVLLTLALALPAAAQDATDVPLPTEPAPDAAQTPAAPAAAQPAASAAEAPGAVLRGLDKMAGATTDLAVRNGETADYGTLKVTVSDCRYPQGDPAADAWAHLTIADRSGKALFDGWMIASSPALSALDHPRYDIWVIRCISN